MLWHNRIICYGIHHINTQIKKHEHIAFQNYSDSLHLSIAEKENVDTLYVLVKKGTLIDRLKYCLDQHQVRKMRLENMIVEQNFEEIMFEEIKGDFYKNPLFFGRANVLMNKNHPFFAGDGYSSMPWVTYTTLLSKDKSHLIFCWLKSDSEHAVFLNELDTKHIEILAYGHSDAFAVSKNHYDENSLAIDEIFKVFRTY